MEPDKHSLIRIIAEELIENRIWSHFYYPNYVRNLCLKGDERVLEFGSGGGLVSRALAQTFSPDGSLTCVDISEYWISKAQKRLRKFKNIEFRQGDVTHMDLPENAYDGVIIHFVLHDVDPAIRIDVMNSLAKTMRPEGTLFIREPTSRLHGMPLSEIRNLMRDAGLREHHTSCKKSLIWKSIYDGVFIKSW